MPKAVFITGFNNWGKTSVINGLFHGEDWRENKRYNVNGVPRHIHHTWNTRTAINFIVQNNSNDDVSGGVYIDRLTYRINSVSDYMGTDCDLIAAICPTIYNHNDFRELLNADCFNHFEHFHFVLLKYRCDYLAELRLEEVTSLINQIERPSTVHIVDNNTLDESGFINHQETMEAVLDRLRIVFPEM